MKFWEYFLPKPPKAYKFWELMPELKEGKRIKRKGWDETLQLHPSGSIDFSSSATWDVRLTDLEADDWILVDK